MVQGYFTWNMGTSRWSSILRPDSWFQSDLTIFFHALLGSTCKLDKQTLWAREWQIIKIYREYGASSFNKANPSVRSLNSLLDLFAVGCIDSLNTWWIVAAFCKGHVRTVTLQGHGWFTAVSTRNRQHALLLTICMPVYGNSQQFIINGDDSSVVQRREIYIIEGFVLQES